MSNRDRFGRHKLLGVKRLMREAVELSESTEDYCAKPSEDSLFDWHFTVRGPPDSVYEDGIYHGQLLFPSDYPLKPPSIILFTPNGRFRTNKQICLSISGHHPETWQPSWSVRTALVALRAFMPTGGNGALGSLDYSDVERRRLAAKSRSWRCESCGPIFELLKPINSDPVREETPDSGSDRSQTNSSEQSSTTELESDLHMSSNNQTRDVSPRPYAAGERSENCPISESERRVSLSTSQDTPPPAPTIIRPSTDANSQLLTQTIGDQQSAAQRTPHCINSCLTRVIFVLLLLLVVRRLVIFVA